MQIKIRIEQDPDPESPREHDNLGVMVCFHRRYNLGDSDHGLREGQFDGWDDLAKYLTEEEDAICMLPLYLYDHSGITISTGSFSCSWDSGQVGFIYTTQAKVAKFFGSIVTLDRVKECLQGEVEAYDQYLTGDVWGYVLEDEDGEHLDSCWGFYGHDFCEEEANRVADYYREEEAKRLEEERKAKAALCPPHVMQ